jgi:nucleotide-binding universal stress UspA family protein
MIRIERIFCPTDLSARSGEALRYAVALARAYEARLFLFYCVVGTHRKNGDGSSSTTSREVKAVFEEALTPHLGLAVFSELNWEGIIVDGTADAGEEIVRQAARLNADLIVMRSRRRPHAAVLLGSTAEVVCRTAPCPILVTHPREREWVGSSTGDIDLRRVLVAYDFSADSELALGYGISLAQEYQAELHLLHVLPVSEQEQVAGARANAGTEGAYERAAYKLQRAVPREAFLWCGVVHVVRWGKAYQEVLSYAKENAIDLICMGTSGKDFTMEALFGSNVDRVLRQAPCPVLVARPLEPAYRESGNVANA